MADCSPMLSCRSADGSLEARVVQESREDPSNPSISTGLASFATRLSILDGADGKLLHSCQHKLQRPLKRIEFSLDQYQLLMQSDGFAHKFDLRSKKLITESLKDFGVLDEEHANPIVSEEKNVRTFLKEIFTNSGTQRIRNLALEMVYSQAQIEKEIRNETSSLNAMWNLKSEDMLRVRRTMGKLPGMKRKVQNLTKKMKSLSSRMLEMKARARRLLAKQTRLKK
mmetsp:Transcript_1528/g.3493  ORF Transcript_1528/g.3493 Transcript_1528/m.3493 type:complete len:226 (+) Transcript_1528:1410-2087(+)